MKLKRMALQWPMWRYPLGSGGNLVKTISPNYLFLASRAYLLLRADFIYLPISYEMSLMWNTYSSWAASVVFAYYFTGAFSGFFFLSATTFSGNPLAFQIPSNKSLRSLPSTKGIFSLIFPKKSNFFESWLASTMLYSMIFWIYYWLNLTPTPQSLANCTRSTPPLACLFFKYSIA